MIKTREVTVMTLLAFAMQNANANQRVAMKATRDTISHEQLCQKILNYRMYMQLIEMMTEAINKVMERDPIIKADDEIGKINGVFEFLNAKKVMPRCKQLNSTVNAEQFFNVKKDERIINLANQALKDNIPDAYFETEWSKHSETHRQDQDKAKTFEFLQTKFGHLLGDYKQPKDTPINPETSSEASFVSSVSQSNSIKPRRPRYSPSDLTKEIIDNVPIFDGKTNKLNQFINTIKSVASLYHIPEIQIVSLCTRGNPNKIITHTIEDDTEANWANIKRKLINNYRPTNSRIDAGRQLAKIARKENETVGEYLARARTLFKTKLRSVTQWSTEYDPSDMYKVVDGLKSTGLRRHILKRIEDYKSYKQCFDHIESQWEKTHYLDNNHIEQSQSNNEVNEIDEWDDTLMEDPQEQVFQADINEVYQRHGRQYQYNQHRFQNNPGYQFQGNRPHYNRSNKFSGSHFNNPQQFTPRHQSTTVANQAYTFNGTTAHPSVNYAPGMLNTGPTHQHWGYQAPSNQYQPYPNQFANRQQTPTFNSFTHNNSQAPNKNTPDGTNMIIEQMTKLLNSFKTTPHQVQEVTAQATAGAWDLGQASELPQTPTQGIE